jgi:hypothetical protein
VLAQATVVLDGADTMGGLGFAPQLNLIGAHFIRQESQASRQTLVCVQSLLRFPSCCQMPSVVQLDGCIAQVETWRCGYWHSQAPWGPGADAR